MKKREWKFLGPLPSVADHEAAFREPEGALTRMDEPQVDTSSEAVERAARRVERYVNRPPRTGEVPPIWLMEVLEKMRALAAERDELAAWKRAAEASAVIASAQSRAFRDEVHADMLSLGATASASSRSR